MIRRRSGFAPDDLSDCVLWLDPTNGTPRTSGNVAATNGQAVETWLATGSTSVTAAGEGSFGRPTFLSNQLNGLPALEFDADLLLLSSAWVTAGVWTLFAIAKADTLGGAERFIYAGRNTGAGTSARMYLHQTDAQHRIGVSSTGNLTAVNATTDTAWRLKTFIRAATTGELIVRGVGSNSASNSTLQSPGIAALGGLTNSAGTTVANQWEGKIAEVIGYNRVLSSAEITQVTNYLAAKWNL
jgi:hypothetical protein